jgi:hypothetical protein
MQLQVYGTTFVGFNPWLLAQEKQEEKAADEVIAHIAEDGGESAEIPETDTPVSADYEPTSAENAWNELESFVYPDQ